VEGVVDALSGLEKLEIRGQVLVVIGGFRLYLCRAMLRAESGARIGNEETALTAVGSAIGAAKG
jgi:hypothetical protein